MTRVGFGFDVHPFADRRKLVLGGVEVAHPRGLAGHSDADVLSHAVADALLGAAGEGDLGQHFPASEPRWKGCSSLVFLEAIREILNRGGFRIVNVDCTVVAERPKVLPYVGAIRESLGRTLGIEAARIGVKGKTCEGLGAIGREEGMAAYAVALLEARKEPIGGGGQLRKAPRKGRVSTGARRT
ncbi:MAG: 2-C-methyl-D-erythritol 2,4-cyclodiphosphate synthase [Candidatus Wallbacteria bacterium]|nr:2-C-methyl-D-erythritol 2,4-cyclodiphosphate synthase [Candidatus Wallbacteria bacterium]MBI4865715.1 2-C-methyl-D-erythritol 2,4-cyclodiphosphate synthase [Candidatus Wallbacteria bacterium]